MSQSRSITRVAGPILAMAAGALALVQIVSWMLWGFDTPPQGAVNVLLAGAVPGLAAFY